MEKTIQELQDKINLLEDKTILLEKKQEQSNILFYEHLQFMNYSQKIKNLENALQLLKYETSCQNKNKWTTGYVSTPHLVKT